MTSKSLNKVIADFAQLPYKSLFITFVMVLSLFTTVELSSQSLFRRTQAQEISLPPGYTALEYLQSLGQADINNDGMINLFDYAAVVEEDYGKNDSFLQSDVNFDQKVNAIDSSFMVSHFYTDVDDERQKVFASAQYIQEINKEIAQRNEDVLPVSNLEDATVSITSESGGSSPEYGRTVIPTVLGTVSAYTGASSYSYEFVLPAGPGGLKPSLGLTYSSATVDDGRNQGSDGGRPFYVHNEAFIPGQVGLGFSFTGVGAIVRDSKEEKEVYKIKGNLHHRYILNLPGSVSAELKYNPTTGRWVSIPQAFLKIEHKSPGIAKLGEYNYLDPWDWQITTKDGTTYYFGEEDISTKLAANARINGSEDSMKGDSIVGSKNGNLYNEFDAGFLCKGESEKDPCRDREENGKALIVTKWLLRKVQTPDGRIVEYTYDTQQQKIKDKPWENSPVEYVASSSFPKEITWNDAKHRVRFTKEERPDKGPGEYMRERVKEVIVETKKQQDNQFYLVRKYVLGYYDQNENTRENLGLKAADTGRGVGINEPIDNDFKATFLTSVQEYGKDGSTALPPVTFRYVQFAFGSQGHHSGETYLWKVNNGYGGETRFNYVPYIVGWFNPYAKGVSQTVRVRVAEKVFDDLVSGKMASARETYTYNNPRGFTESLRKTPKGESTPTAQEFLGHASVEVKQYDHDGTLLAHSETFFNQFNQADKCNEPHPAKGQPYRQVVYKGEGKDVVQQTDSNYRYRLDGKDGQDPSASCDNSRRSQPLFLYSYDTLNYQKEDAKDFVPAVFKNQVDAKYHSRSELRTLQRSLQFDEFGNQTLAVSYGEVDQNGYDITTDDNRYSYSSYVTAGAAWIKGLPYISYTSYKADCGQDDLSCQWGRTKNYYDNFDKNYWELTWEQMQPRYGFLTQKESWIDDTHKTVAGQEYWDISGNAKDNDMRKGAVWRTYGPKPNIKSVDDPKNQVTLLSETKYDTYYNTLILEEKNALGYKTTLDYYDDLLQLPTFVKKQIQKSPDAFAVTKMVFDPLGRMKVTFSPDPDAPGFAQGQPTTLVHYFEKGNQGLIVRKAAVSSITPDGKYHYQVNDTFYDGLGQVRQAQALQTNIDGKDARVVTINEYQADGKSLRTYEVQTAQPLLLREEITSANYATAIASTEPEYLANVPKVVNAETKYDLLRRPYETTKIDTFSGQRLTTKTEYGILSTRSVSPKGLSTTSMSDVLGRTLYATVVDASGQQGMLTKNEYGKQLVDLPTKTIIQDTKGEKIETTYDYDESGRVLVSTDPSLGKYTYDYDVAGNKIYEKGPDRGDMGMSYDVLGRLIKKEYFTLTQGELYNKIVRDEVNYTYDNGAFAIGMLSKAEHLTGEKTFTYDGGQRLTSTNVKIFNNNKEFKTTFNKLSQELTSTYPDGTVLKKEYDREGRLAKMLANGKETVLGATYDKFGRQVQSVAVYGGNEYTSKNTFDNVGRLRNTSIRKKFPAVGVGLAEEEIFAQDLQYNDVSEIEKITENVNKKENAFEYGYDSFSQLATVRSPLYNASYRYDLFGRILEKSEKDKVSMSYDNKFPFFAPKSASVVTQRTDGADSRLYNFSYTDEGNMQNDVNNCYAYNREGELIQLQVKNSPQDKCSDQKFKKIFRFYYDDEGKMNLQEEYDPKDLNKPTKQVYLFGQYEEEVTN